MTLSIHIEDIRTLNISSLFYVNEGERLESLRWCICPLVA